MIADRAKTLSCLAEAGTRHTMLPAAGNGHRPLILDIGGEGRYPEAWNLNPSKLRTLGPQRGQPIPRHIPGRAEAIPLPDRSVDVVIAERTPLRRAALHEIARVVSDRGIVILRHALLPGRDCHELARQIIPGLMAQQIIKLGRHSLQESVFCPHKHLVDDVEPPKMLACQAPG